ncbi:MAG: efflux RND transporter permease subunit, partial [Gammaproteobacteria bacterium]|nr:efflux RND transporter permease subunit [Gammaproteobacteria bacterium]NIR32801.1 efflux RND transporter permease subunit [Gammaproteobacteria bacterium]NIR99351.1 efflux RND transporter permease subunit [Gammaproteobacteria bacterium]NIT64962.1 efflux RND transporter permease subunit [Gammaproteobacteria bacterium]NIV21979.1 hypothetical protein [Gammaproteobacteria bacterium]
TLQKRGVEFFPTTEPETTRISIEAPPGTALNVSDGHARTVEERLQPFRDTLEKTVTNVGQRQGFGGAQGSSATSHLSYLTLEFPDWQHWTRRPSEVVRELRAVIGGIAGADVKVVPQQHGPPTGAPVNIEVRGQELGRMLAVTEDIKRRIKDLPGLVNLADDFDRSRPELRVEIDREKAARLGLSTRDIALTVRTAFNGRKVSEFREGKEEYDIVVRLDTPFRAEPSHLDDLYLRTPAGRVVPLSEVARVTSGPAYGAIRHIELDRVITVSADAAEGTPGPVLLARVQKRLADLALPEGISLRYTGENEDREESQAFLVQSFYVALFLIFLV